MTIFRASLILINATIILIFSSCQKSKNNQEFSGWNLIWQDEFDYDSDKLSENWNFEEGYGSNGWGNDEWQYYSKENTSIESGNLVITAKTEGKINKRDKSVTSSRLQTYQKFDF